MNILQKITAEKREAVRSRKGRAYLQTLRSQIADAGETRRFREALSGGKSPRLIAEVKKASPSKGILREDFDPVKIAQIYEAGGAAALSVLTEEHYFLGKPADLKAIRQKVGLPLLQKDFIVDELQVYEARAWGGDALLLIAALLENGQLRDYFALACDLSLSVLIEVHTEAELARVIEWAPILGINNRNLTTFETDIETTFRLLKEMPSGRTVVSESGIHDRAAVERLGAAGVDAILVGESLMVSEDIEKKMKALLGG